MNPFRFHEPDLPTINMELNGAAGQHYNTDLDYIEEEMYWLVTRCRILALQEDLEAGPRRAGNAEWEAEQLAGWSALSDCKENARNLRTHIDSRLRVTREYGKTLTLDDICDEFQLDEFERSVLLLGVAVAFCKETRRAVARISDNSCGLAVTGAFAFAGLSLRQRVHKRETFFCDSPLRQHDLIVLHTRSRSIGPEDFLDSGISITSRVFHAILGRDDITDQLVEFSSLEDPRGSFEQVVLPEAERQRIVDHISQHERVQEVRKNWGLDDVVRYGKGLLMLFYGPPGTGKTLTAHAVADMLGKRVLNVDVATFSEHMQAERYLPGLFRQARLKNAVLFFDECEAILSSRQHGNKLMTQLLTEFERFEGLAVLATNLPSLLDEAIERRIQVKVPFRRPDSRARCQIWEKHLPAPVRRAEDVCLQRLAADYDLAGGHIKNAVLTAVSRAVVDNPDAPVLAHCHLDQAAREQLLKPVVASTLHAEARATLQHVILPRKASAQVEEILAVARHGATLAREWGVGGSGSFSRSAVALFTGAPGTGKSLTAEAVAGTLGRPLLRVTASEILSKWVGESESRMSSVFDEARSQRAVLFLDEVDSLLTTRDGGTRHDVSLVNTLLVRLEQHDGVVLMATNRPTALDTALRRRVRWVVEFQAPDQPARKAIWSLHLPEDQHVASCVDPGALADYSLTGAEIRNVVERACLRALMAGEQVTQARLVGAVREEVEDVTEPRVVGFGG